MTRQSIVRPLADLTRDETTLLNSALQAATNSYSPYSSITVGAALLTGGGAVYRGTNVENASYGLTICAERAAVAAAVAAGERDFVLLAIASPRTGSIVPCGACLQVLSEFCDDLRILLQDGAGGLYETRLSQLLPEPFSSGESGSIRERK